MYIIVIETQNSIQWGDRMDVSTEETENKSEPIHIPDNDPSGKVKKPVEIALRIIIIDNSDKC